MTPQPPRHSLCAKFVAVLVLVAAPLTGVLAASPEECRKMALNLAQEAQDRNLSNAKLNTIEDLIAAMELNCRAKKFDAAANDAGRIRAAIGD